MVLFGSEPLCFIWLKISFNIMAGNIWHWPCQWYLATHVSGLWEMYMLAFLHHHLLSVRFLTSGCLSSLHRAGLLWVLVWTPRKGTWISTLVCLPFLFSSFLCEPLRWITIPFSYPTYLILIGIVSLAIMSTIISNLIWWYVSPFTAPASNNSL